MPTLTEKDWQTLRKITEMNKAQQVTACMVYLAHSTNFKGVTSNKQCGGLTGLCFESPNDTIHANRWQQSIKSALPAFYENTERLLT